MEPVYLLKIVNRINYILKTCLTEYNPEGFIDSAESFTYELV